MKKSSLLSLLLLCCIVILTAWKLNSSSANSNIIPPQPAVDSAEKEINILPQILAINSADGYKPPKDFRKGEVTPTTINNYLKKTENGYCITLPSNTNIPTPAVVNGTLYLSGGFGSRQYYAFEAETGKNKWAVNLDDDGPSSPAIEDDIVVFNTESCTIFACDMVTGRHLWSYFLGDPLMSMPTIANGIVFTAYPAYYGGSGDESRIITNNNNQPAKANISPKINTKVPAVKQANNVQINPSHVLIALELKTGKILWQKWIDSDIMSAPVAKDDLLYVTTFSGALYKVKQKTGDIIEAKALRATSAPVIGSGGLILSRRSDNASTKTVGEAIQMRGVSTYRKEAAYLDKNVQSSSRLKAEAVTADAGNGFAGGAPASANHGVAYDNIGQSNVSSLQGFQGSRAFYRDGNLFSTMGDEVVCTDSTGKVKWKHKLSGDMHAEGGYMGTPPIYANGYIIVATLKGEVLVFDEQKGTMIKKYEVKDAIRYQPVVDKGWIFVTTVNSKLYAINTGDKKITGWNMWGANAARTNERVGKVTGLP